MSLFSDDTPRPLADRVRPKSLKTFIGQHHVVGEGKFLHSMISGGTPTSLILWGPPGSGKTTLARIIATSGNFAFEEISAVTSGLPDVKKVIERAGARKKLGQATVLFVDEIHRFNKAQQDAFLPHVENGTIILIGATTENPSFEVIGPLLSRARVVTLESLSHDHILAIIEQGMREIRGKNLEPEAAQLLAKLSGGDARVALSGLETAATLAGAAITVELIKQAMQKPVLRYDKNGEYHYNLISAYIKSLRGGAVDAALFYLARMIESGEDPKFIARRLVIFASEDVGLADNTMLDLAISTFAAIERIGLPEGRIVLAHASIALAQAPKDRRAYDAIGKAISAAHAYPTAQVPLHLRNAPTKLMREQGYGKDYQWEPGFEHGQGFMPEEIAGETFFTPTPDKKTS